MSSTQITEMNRTSAKRVSAAIREALRAVETDLGVQIKLGSNRFDPTGGNATVKLTVACVDKRGEAMTPEREALRRYSFEFGGEDIYGSTFTSRGDRYRVIGYKPRARRYPVVAERVSDGRKYKFSARAIHSALSL